MKEIKDFTKVFVEPNYGVETLINGNVSECIRYFNELLECGVVGVKTVIEEMNTIYREVPQKYKYILDNVSVPGHF